MSTATTQFPIEELNNIDKADDLKISPLRADGATYGTPNWVWEVVVEGNLYVRAYNGTSSRWYQSALKQKAGRIHAAGMLKDVAFEPVSNAAVNQQIDEAYQKKYSSSPYMQHMIGYTAKSDTIQIILK